MGNPEGQRVYQEHMAALMAPLGVTPRFDGLMGNTLHAHRVIQYFQEEKGAETANALIDALYKRYFTQGMHPAADETLVESCVEAGIDEEEAKKVVENKETGLRSAKDKLRTVAMDADAVPIVSVEGKKRDITMNGAKEVADYVKALETIAKEST
jgi:predicted DsbA family dithiol-disulfide isomerase